MKFGVTLMLAGLLAVPLSGQDAGGTRVTTDHLTVTSRLSAEVVAPGVPFTLVLDVAPRAGLHVYAPGAKGYKVVAFTPDASPVLDMKPLQYPSSEIYVFKPLNERMPVFQKPFTLLLPLALRANAKAKSVEVKGTLEYQACSDTICFTPQKLRVSHLVRIK